MTLRPVTWEEFKRFMSVVEIAAGRSLSDEVFADALATYDVSRTLGVFEGGTLVGGTGSDLLELTLPGLAIVPVARITHTGILPTHRRRGLVTKLFAAQVQALRAAGLTMAVFTTSGPGIYRRVGYAPASLCMDLAIEVDRSGDGLFDSPIGSEGTYCLIEPADMPTVMPAMFDAHRRLTPGQVRRSASFWKVWFRDRPRYRPNGSGERFAISWEDEGYLSYRLGSAGTLIVEDLIATTSHGHRALWEWCLDFRQARSVEARNVSLDDPLLWALRDPRRLAINRVGDFLWLRVLNVPGALVARSYVNGGSIVFDVQDAVCPENTGHYCLDTRSISPSCGSTTDAADIRLNIADLGAVYLGGVSFTSLARAGRIEVLSDTALDRADSIFSSSPLPWTATAF